MVHNLKQEIKGKVFQKQEHSVRVLHAAISQQCPKHIPLSCKLFGHLLLKLKEAMISSVSKIQLGKMYVSNHHSELQPQFSKVLNCA